MATTINAGNATTGAAISADTTGILQLQSGSTPTTAVTINTSQNVSIGSTSAVEKLNVNGSIRLTVDNNGLFFNGSQDAITGDGTNHTLSLYTSNTERMRIDSSGIVYVGKTAASNTVYGTAINSTGQLLLVVKTGNSQGVFLNRQDDTGNAITFRQANSDVGSISVTGSTTSYNITSDYRLKENVVPMTNALATVSSLKPVTYKWKLTGENGQGFIAHELQSIVPDCVTGEKDAIDEEGNPKYQGIDTSFLVATLTSAIQELNAKVTALEAKLESK